MSIPDEERFEAYLKQFKALSPDPLPLEHRQSLRTRWIVGIAAAVTAILSFTALHTSRGHGTTSVVNPVRVEAHAPSQPLTLRSANDMLRTQPSYKAALDALAISDRKSAIPDDKQSAIAVLAKERIKL